MKVKLAPKEGDVVVANTDLTHPRATATGCIKPGLALANERGEATGRRKCRDVPDATRELMTTAHTIYGT